MSMYDQLWQNNYETLLTLYPVWYREVLEMNAILEAMGEQLDDVQNSILRVVDNNFIATSQAYSIDRMEEFLSIVHDNPRTLEERRALIASFFIGNGRIGEQEIKAIVQVFTEGDVLVDFAHSTVIISVIRDVAERLSIVDCMNILKRRIPVHLRLMLVDQLLPIVFKGTNKLRLQCVWIQAFFYNFGVANITLSGERLLDGAWLLSSGHIAGMALKEFSMLMRWVTTATAHMGAVAFLISLAQPQQRYTFAGLSIHVFVKNQMSIQMPQMRIAAHLQNANTLTGSLTRDSLYFLDGSIPLNGTRNLNATIIEEEL